MNRRFPQPWTVTKVPPAAWGGVRTSAPGAKSGLCVPINNVRGKSLLGIAVASLESIGLSFWFRLSNDQLARRRNRQPLLADDRNYYKVEKWTKDGTKVDRMLDGGNGLGRARSIFETAIKHRPGSG
jgi:hypothetical protein